MKRKLMIALVITLAFIAIGSLVPFETTLVPEWRLKVIDENGKPYKGQLVREFCYSHTLGISPCFEADDFMQTTDENGYVLFPERNIKASLASRAIRSVVNYVLTFADGSYGVDVYVDSSWPQGFKRLEYRPGEPLPTEFILPSTGPQ